MVSLPGAFLAGFEKHLQGGDDGRVALPGKSVRSLGSNSDGYGPTGSTEVCLVQQ